MLSNTLRHFLSYFYPLPREWSFLKSRGRKVTPAVMHGMGSTHYSDFGTFDFDFFVELISEGDRSYVGYFLLRSTPFTLSGGTCQMIGVSIFYDPARKHQNTTFLDHSSSLPFKLKIQARNLTTDTHIHGTNQRTPDKAAVTAVTLH